MCKVALIDDYEDQYEKYRIRLAKRGIELIFMDFIPDYSKIVEWLLKEKIEFVLLDYKLDTKYSFQGSQLMQYINNEIPDLQCVLFTSNTADDDLVMDKLKVNKNVFSSMGEEFEEFITMINQAASVFKNRMDATLVAYEEMQHKKANNELSEEEIEYMYSVYKRLYSYGWIEYLPKEYFEVNLEEKIDNLIMVMKEIVEGNEE